MVARLQLALQVCPSASIGNRSSGALVTVNSPDGKPRRSNTAGIDFRKASTSVPSIFAAAVFVIVIRVFGPFTVANGAFGPGGGGATSRIVPPPEFTS